MATLRVYISRLRRALGDGSAVVVTQPPGYRITLGESELDADRFARRGPVHRGGAARPRHVPGRGGGTGAQRPAG